MSLAYAPHHAVALALLFALSAPWSSLGQTASPPSSPPDSSFGQRSALTSAEAEAAANAAYESLKTKNYFSAISSFGQAVAVLSERASLRKDFAYALLKAGRREAARDQFKASLDLDPTDDRAALEYAFLCYETKMEIDARRTFLRLHSSSNEEVRRTASTAFENIDRQLRDGIARWTQAVASAPGQYSAHEELARLAEQRDETALALTHYREAFRLKPDRRRLMLDIARVASPEDTIPLRLALSRSSEPRLAEEARALLPARYPYPYEFERAIALDPSNAALRREHAFLLLAMDRKPEAAAAFAELLRQHPDDETARRQLDLLEGRTPPEPRIPIKEMARRSFEMSYLNDALRYYRAALEDSPNDPKAMLGLAKTYNQLGRDRDALRWFNLARRSGSSPAARQAGESYSRLRETAAPFHFTTWMLPFYSSRWSGGLLYGQMKGEWSLGSTRLRPYVSMRLMADTQGRTSESRVNPYFPAYLSESAVILGGGVLYPIRHGLLAWGEAGQAVSYIQRRHESRTRPDFRGGLSYSKGFGHQLGASTGWFAEAGLDGVYVSRFRNDVLAYVQARTGYTVNGAFQLLWNWQVTADRLGEYWGNFVEAGPGVRLRWSTLPKGVTFRIDTLRGVHLRNASNPLRPNYWDFRAGLWYGFTH
ncbi:MAG: tetratricopeptide repeat protein [Bryobacteraceae bacterium]|nr:tetratricopeptide repeat protein [Bryobacteraceae bacterium]